MIRSLPPIAVLLALSLSGCLTVEKKEYRIRLNSDFSGEATITFVNIRSESDDTTDISADDFQQLIEYYLRGQQIEQDNPGYRAVRKRLFERDGVLTGELTFSFDSLSVMRILRYDRTSPLMYLPGAPISNEQIVETNGTLGPDWLPAIFWPKDATELTFTTRVIPEAGFHRSLLGRFRDWQAAQESGNK